MSHEPLPDEEDDLDLLEDEAPEVEAAPKAPPPRFYCAGADVKDEEDGQACCDHKARNRWYGACPKCRRLRACLPIKRVAESRMRMNLGDLTKVKAMKYWSTGIKELDHVLGGGIVLGNVILLAGERGAGKTTVLLQAAKGFASAKRKVYICSGEDSRDRVVQYCQRIGVSDPNIEVFGDPRGLDVEDVVADAREMGIRLLIVDSAQVCAMSEVKADVGQVAQLDSIINFFSSFAKQKNVAVIIIGHLTKDGEIAGSEKMQHLVDVLLRFDKKPMLDGEGRDIVGDKTPLREFWIDGKNRQGTEDATALMEMTSTGLVSLSDEMRRRITRLHLG